MDESSLHPDCQGKQLVWTDGKYFYDEFKGALAATVAGLLGATDVAFGVVES